MRGVGRVEGFFQAPLGCLSDFNVVGLGCQHKVCPMRSTKKEDELETNSGNVLHWDHDFSCLVNKFPASHILVEGWS